jgi:hypothetical protein
MIKHYSNNIKQQSAEQKRRIDTSTMTGVLVSSTLVDNLLLIVGIFLSCFCSSLHSTSSVSPKSNPPNAYLQMQYTPPPAHPPAPQEKIEKKNLCPNLPPLQIHNHNTQESQKNEYLKYPQERSNDPQG